MFAKLNTLWATSTPAGGASSMPLKVGAVFDCILNTIVQYAVDDRSDIMAAQISTDWHPVHGTRELQSCPCRNA